VQWEEKVRRRHKSQGTLSKGFRKKGGRAVQPWRFLTIQQSTLYRVKNWNGEVDRTIQGNQSLGEEGDRGGEKNYWNCNMLVVESGKGRGGKTVRGSDWEWD